jgi:hypothetical protein
MTTAHTIRTGIVCLGAMRARTLILSLAVEVL